MKTWLPILASILLIGAAPPPDAATKGDLRCFVALAILADTGDDPGVKEAASAGTLYFLGRLDGRSPALDIKAAVTAEAPAMTESEIRSLLKSCGDTLKGRGDYLIAVSKALEKSGK